MQFYEKNFRRLYLVEERKLDDTTFYAKVKLSPYQKGQGITVANTLRRILLNEIDCIAIQSAQIQGVSHEFTVKPGIRESIPEILCNLRKIAFRSDFTDKHTSQGYLYQSKRWPGIRQAYTRPQKCNSVYYASNTNQTTGGSESEYCTRECKNALSDTLTNANCSIDNFKIITKCEKHTPGVLYAQDISLPNDIKCVAPKQKIATLVSPHTSLHLNIVLVRSKQYSEKSAHENMQVLDFTSSAISPYPDYYLKRSSTGTYPDEYIERNSTQTNTAFTGAYKYEESTLECTSTVMNAPFLPIDTIFNPVKKINYSIHQESYNNTNQECIFLEIWTDGSCYPLESIAKASLVMRQMFQPFTF